MIILKQLPLVVGVMVIPKGLQRLLAPRPVTPEVLGEVHQLVFAVDGEVVEEFEFFDAAVGEDDVEFHVEAVLDVAGEGG
jgi:hypothetical protein